MNQDPADQAMSLLSDGTYQRTDSEHVIILEHPKEFVAALDGFFLGDDEQVGAGTTHERTAGGETRPRRSAPASGQQTARGPDLRVEAPPRRTRSRLPRAAVTAGIRPSPAGRFRCSAGTDLGNPSECSPRLAVLPRQVGQSGQGWDLADG